MQRINQVTILGRYRLASTTFLHLLIISSSTKDFLEKESICSPPISWGVPPESDWSLRIRSILASDDLSLFYTYHLLSSVESDVSSIRFVKNCAADADSLWPLLTAAKAFILLKWN